MHNPENQKYFKIALTCVGVIAVSLFLFFLMFRIGEIMAWLKMVARILSAFCYGAVFAYVLTPACNRFEALILRFFPKARHGVVAGTAIAITMLLALAVVFVLIVLVIPQVWYSIVGIVNAIPGQLDNANQQLHALLADKPHLQTYWDSTYSTLETTLTNWLKTDPLSTVERLISGFSSGIAAFIDFVKNVFIGILIAIYFLSGRKRFAAQSRLLLCAVCPKAWADRVEEEVRFADRMFNGFLNGKLLDSAIIGVICFIGTAIMGFRSALLISVVVGITNVIPFFGPFIGAIPCAILLLLENPLHCLYFLIFIIILQQLDGNVIGPKILGNTTGLSSFWVLFSILLFGGLWGIVGMVVGVPLFAVIYDIIQRLVVRGLQRHGRADLLDAYQRAFVEPPKPQKPSKHKFPLPLKKSPDQPGTKNTNPRSGKRRKR